MGCGISFGVFIARVAGAVAAALTIYGFWLAGYWNELCPSTNGRPCNAPYGQCQPDGQCVCVPAFSGDDCGETLCGGYNENSGAICSNRGICTGTRCLGDACVPNLVNIPPACNSYTGGSWLSPQCTAQVAVWQARAPTNLSYAFGVPQCICSAPYLGPACLENMCPMSTDLGVCSGNGLPTVNYTANNTQSGLGCQCPDTFSFLQPDLLAGLDRFGLAVVGEGLPGVFSETYCGVAYTVPNYTNALFAVQPTSANCFCKPGWSGVDCDLGMCPQLSGVPCAGRGHPSFGQGLSTNTSFNSTALGVPCAANCVPGLVSCNATCGIDCAHLLVCPAAQPWRCADMSCRAAPATCLAGTSYGYLDDLDLARNYFLQPGFYNFSSPLVFYSFFGPGTLQYGDVLVTSPNATQAFGVFEMNYTDIFDWADAGFALKWLANPNAVGDVEMYPAPFLFYPQGAAPPFSVFLLKSPAGQVVMDFIKPNLYLVPATNLTALAAGAYVLANYSLGYLRPAGDYVSTQTCLANIPGCAWTWNGTAVVSGAGQACAAGPAPASADCLPPPSLYVVNTTFTGRQHVYQNDYYPVGVWELFLPAQTFYPVTVSGNVSFLELITAPAPTPSASAP